MNSKGKKIENQKSILNFFSVDSGNNSNKRTHSEMLHGEIDTTKQQQTKIQKIEKNEKNRQENPYEENKYSENQMLEKKQGIIDLERSSSEINEKKKKIINDYDEESEEISKNLFNNKSNKNFDQMEICDEENSKHIQLSNKGVTQNKDKIIKIEENNDKMEYITKLFGNYKTATKTKAKTNDQLSHDDFEDISSELKVKKNKTEKKTNKKKSIGIHNIGDDASENNSEKQNFFENPQIGLPEFLRGEQIRDKMGRKLNHPEYDATTLLVPQEYVKKCTPAMQQYWTFKADNFDKVLFFKLGKFYELFYDDAIVGNRVLDLNWMGNDPKKLHVGFPEKSLEEKAFVLIENGYKVAVIEQVETTDEMEERTKGIRSANKADKCIKRDLCNVFTKGTYIHEGQKYSSKQNYMNRFCITLFCEVINNNVDIELTQTNDDEKMAISYNQGLVGYEWNFIIFDVTTLDFFFGRIERDDENYTKIKTLLYNINPQEIIIVRNNIEDYMVNFISSLASRPLITKVKKEYSMIGLYKALHSHFGENRKDWNHTLSEYINEQNEGMYNVIYYSIMYLEKLLLADQFLKIAKFSKYNSNVIFNKNLILDYQTVSNLEILETKLDPKNIEAGSLLEFMNQSVTPFGMRKMKEWLLNPLSDKFEIEQRLDIVTDLIENFDCVSMFRDIAGKFPDFERMVTKIYKFSIQTNSKAVYFEDFAKNRIQDFFRTIKTLKKSMEIFNIFKNYLEYFKSKDLMIKTHLQSERIVALNGEIGGVVNIVELLEDLEQYYKETKNENGDGMIVPRPGIQKEYDELKELIDEIKQRFEKILKEEKQKLKCPVLQYVHTKNYKYELEVPEDFTKDKHIGSRYKLTTSRKGFMRFHTPELEDLIEEYEKALDSLKKENNKFNIFLFQKFFSRNVKINKYIESIAELDCLVSLANISNQGGYMTKPKIISLEENKGAPYLKLINSRHPCISQRIKYFVPNDIIIGENNKSTLVVTGPNMGGKSTILRQVCILVIMSQVGCYVPADEFILTPKDRIFTRIGAKDKILEGKSTFYIELEETKNILENATINSLAIVDELGRGTSTNDGMIIAKTILEILQSSIKCLCLFTTHYHDLIDWCKRKKNVDLFFMNCLVDKNNKDIKFLYKFSRGSCHESYGINVAKLAGLPIEVLDAATEVSETYRKFNEIKIDYSPLKK